MRRELQQELEARYKAIHDPYKGVPRLAKILPAAA